jgi:hypothetical protein
MHTIITTPFTNQQNKIGALVITVIDKSQPVIQGRGVPSWEWWLPTNLNASSDHRRWLVHPKVALDAVSTFNIICRNTARVQQLLNAMNPSLIGNKLFENDYREL